jgi:hypothetical protein
VTDGGEEAVGGRKMTALIVAVFVLSAMAVATIVSVCVDDKAAGGVYDPD